MTDQYRAPEAIEDEIEQTRSRIEHRLEVLSHNVSPSNLISRALGTEQHSLPDAFNAAINVARSNPLAACLAFAGLAGLAIGGAREPARAPGSINAQTSHPDPAKRIGESAAALKQRATAAADSVQESAISLANQVSDGAVSTATTISEAATDASRYARETAAAVSDTTKRSYAQVEAATDAISQEIKNVPTRARAGGEHAFAWIRENPLPAGLIAVAVGAAAASVATARRSETPQSRLTAGRELYEAAHEKTSERPTSSSTSTTYPSATHRSVSTRNPSVGKLDADPASASGQVAAQSAFAPKRPTPSDVPSKQSGPATSESFAPASSAGARPAVKTPR